MQIRSFLLLASLFASAFICSADPVKVVQKEIRHAQTFYWFALKERGDMRLFNLGLKHVDAAKQALSKVEDNEQRSRLASTIKSLRHDLEEQADMAHDTLYGVFPLLRYATFQDATSELIDDPDVTAVTRASEALSTTVVDHWRNYRQINAVFNSRVSTDQDSAALLDRSWTNNVSFQNEMAYIFNQNNKFFIHNESEVASYLSPTELADYYRNGISPGHADKLCDGFGSSSLMEARIVEIDVMQPYWLYQAEGRIYEKSKGPQTADIFVFGFTKDNRDAFWPIIATWCFFGLLAFGFSRYIGKTFGTSFTQDQWIVPFVSGSVISVFLCQTLGQMVAEPESLVKYGFWSVLMMGASISLLPAFVGLLLNQQVTNRLSFLERFAIGNNAYTILFFSALTAGTSIVPAYSLFLYNDAFNAIQLMGLWALGSFAGTLTITAAVIRLSGITSDNESIQSNNRYTAALSFMTVVVFSALCWWKIPEGDHDNLTRASLGLFIVGGLAGSGISLGSKNPVSMGLLLFCGTIVLLLAGLVFLTNSFPLILGVAIPCLLIAYYASNAMSETLRGVRNEESSSEPVEINAEGTLDLSLGQMLADAENKIPFLENDTFKNCLKEIKERLEAQEPAAVCLTGLPGSGKTRCANEIIKELKADVILRGGCTNSGGHQIPYKPISDAFSDYRLDLSIANAAEWKSALGSTAESLMGVIPLPGIIAGIVESESDEENMVSSPEEIAGSLVQILKSIPDAEGPPPVLFIDDAEYMDEASLKVLEHLITGLKVNNVPMVIAICAGTQKDEESKLEKIGLSLYRVSKMKGDLAHAYLTRKMELEPRLAEKILQETQDFDDLVPMHLIEWISDGCANNEITSQKPFALKVGLDEGDSFLSRFPESLELAAEQTLLKLNEEVLQCLEYAGILGKEFDASHLALAMVKEQPHILGLLEKAEQTGVITDLVLKDDLFAFTSNVYVSVLYNRMLRMEAKPGQRIRAYNKIFTDLFETEFEANGSDKSLFRAANHAQESGEKYQSKAMVLCEKACRRAYAVHAYSEAVAYARHILQLPIDKEHNSPTRRAYLRALVFRAEKITARNPKEREGHLNESLHEWELHIKGCTEVDAEAELLNQIALCQSDLGMFKEAIKSANLSLNLHKISAAFRMEAAHYRARAMSIESKNINDNAGQREALKFFDLAITEAEAIEKRGDRLTNVLAQLYNSRAEARQCLADEETLSLVIKDYEKSLDLKRSINDLPGQAMTLGGMGRFYLYHNDEELLRSNAQKAVNHFQEDERISKQIGDFTGQIKMPSFIGQTYAKLGEHRKAADSFEKSRALARACKRDIDEAFALLGMLEAYKNLNMQKETASTLCELEKFKEKTYLPEFLMKKITTAIS